MIAHAAAKAHVDFDPSETNPMWTARDALAGIPHARGAVPSEGQDTLCRIALPSAAQYRLATGLDGGPSQMAEVVTWDSPLTLLADDADLGQRLRAAGTHVPTAAGSYAERQWDAREALEEAAHRYYDHGERWGVRGMTTRQPVYSVVLVAGQEWVRSWLDALRTPGEGAVADGTALDGGLVIDVREPHDLRVFVLETLETTRALLVGPDGIGEYDREEAITRASGGDA